jgi:hypothetical protein
MGQKYTASLIQILQKTLRDLEIDEEIDRNDPAYRELTRRIARMIAELEVAKQDRIAA